MDSFFLVQLDDSPTFLTGLRNGKPYGTSFPTQALALSFDAAIELSRKFCAEGYGALVVDRFGQPPTAKDLAAVKQRDRQYRVIFSKFFFLQNPKGKDCGTTRITQAAVMSRDAAEAVAKRLRGLGHLDATVVEVDSSNGETEQELARVWPEEFANGNQNEMDQ